MARSPKFVLLGPVFLRGTDDVVLRDVGDSMSGTIADGGLWLEVWDSAKGAWVETTSFDLDDMLEGRPASREELSRLGISNELPTARSLLGLD